ncbi:MAG: hypothetical protein N2595_01195 [bacterium]|nr:hypothetical protein [bacterium]
MRAGEQRAWRGGGCPRLWLCLVAAGLLLTGCAALRETPEGFAPLDEREAARVLAQLAAATNGWQLVKFTMACRVDLPETDTHKARTQNFTATCVWEPGARLRFRVRRYQLTVADILYDGTNWYVTDEVHQRVYRTGQLGRVRIADIPRVFFRQLEQLPQGWITPLESYTVAASPSAYRLETITDIFTRQMIFPRRSPLPSEVMMSTPQGSAIYATLSPPDLTVTPHAAMFLPMTTGYEYYDLDRGERLGP